jgi:hypothetical protein
MIESIYDKFLANLDKIQDKIIFPEFESWVNEDIREKPEKLKINRVGASQSEIIKAIENRAYVGIYYKDDEDEDVLDGYRLIEPYCFGKGWRDRNTGKVTHPNELYLRAYVIMDTNRDEFTKGKFPSRRKSVSKSKRVPYYRMFKAERIDSWMVMNRTFPGYRALYNPNDSNMGKIIAAVEIPKRVQNKRVL